MDIGELMKLITEVSHWLSVTGVRKALALANLHDPACLHQPFFRKLSPGNSLKTPKAHKLYWCGSVNNINNVKMVITMSTSGRIANTKEMAMVSIISVREQQ